MSYNINPAAFSAAFLVPTSVAQKIKIANEKQLKVILYILANLSGGIDAKKISEECGIELSQVEDALLFWQQCELLQGQKEIEKKDEPQPKRIAARDERPSRVDVARRGLEDKNLNMLLNEAQFKFGRNLKTNEAAALVWIYDDLGLDISVILLLLQYALSEKRLNITFLEKTAVKWVEDGIDSVAKAEKYISDAIINKLAWSRVEKIFGIDQRKPSTKETEYARLWLEEWKLDEEILAAAYEECVNQKSKFIMSYTAKIIEKWHKDGVKCVEDIKKKRNKSEQKASFATYDLELFEKKLNSDD